MTHNPTEPGRVPVVLLVLLALFCVPRPLGAQTSEQKLDAVREFQSFFRRTRDLEQRVEAIKTLELAECPEAAEALFDLLGDREPMVVRAAADVFAGYREPEVFARYVAELPEMRDADEQAMMVRILGRAGQKAALPAFGAVLESKRVDEEVRVAVARALGHVGGEAELEMLQRLLQDDSARVRLAATDSAAELDLEGVGPQLIALLADPEWQVKSAAVQACGEVRVAEAIEPLIALMESEDGRIDEEIAEALFRITTFDFGMDAERWRKTWENLKEIPGWRPPTDEELAAKLANRKKYDALYGKKEDAKSFGGIKTVSNAMVFVIDISGSMEDVVTQKEKFQGGGYEDLSKLTIVRTELINTIDSLEPTTRFNILAFARDRKPWKKFLVPANNVNKSSAKRWVERLDVVGGSQTSAGPGDIEAGKTNTFTALMWPFGIDPKKNDDLQPKDPEAALRNEIDTCFFLSDGRPTAGRFVDAQEILEQVFRLNEEFKIVFHTIAIGEVQREFMNQLAQRSGGTFVDLGY